MQPKSTLSGIEGAFKSDIQLDFKWLLNKHISIPSEPGGGCIYTC